MKKNIKFTLIIVSVFIIVLIFGVLGFFYRRNTTQAGLCQMEERADWAPMFGEGPIGCDGQLLPEDSPLIDRSEDRSGWTCYCHTPNTCWNGEKCVPIRISQ